ncbi:MAG: hypothetical protein WEB30_17185, partial [Cyclobacteriaceae bacterium]
MNPRRWLLSGMLALAPLCGVVAQINPVFNPGYSYRQVFDNVCDEPDRLCHAHKMVSWTDSQFAEFAYRGFNESNFVVEFMNWRMIFPLNYDSLRPEKYPLIMMLHGAGESGRIWTGRYEYAPDDVRFDNNGHNILHGGQEHRDAVNRQPTASNAFPGIVMWPQASYNGAWDDGWDNGNQNSPSEMATRIL